MHKPHATTTRSCPILHHHSSLHRQLVSLPRPSPRQGLCPIHHQWNQQWLSHRLRILHPAVISTNLQQEVRKGHLVGPLNPSDYPFVHTSSLGAVPKKHCIDKWRLILDLSHPKGASVNDGIARNLCSLSYMKVDDVVQQVLQLGRGALLAKIDIESAFRNIPVHPHDRHLLGMRWCNQLYIDTVLPFGLRSAPKIFNCIADALQWIGRKQGITYLEHFLDDFITSGAPSSEECKQNLSLLIWICDKLGLPLAIDKQEGPSTCLVYLGIEVDTENLELRLPLPKLLRLQSTLTHWANLKCSKKRNLESLVGQLHDASIVVRPGRTFIRRLIDLLKASHHRSANSFIRLNVEARSDIMWWCRFIEHWNGLSMMHQSRRNSPSISLTSDASGSWGCGTFYQEKWFQYKWNHATQDYHITFKELLPIVISAALWGPHWANQTIQCHCDNESVVHIINTGTSKDQAVMGLMRCLHFIAARFNMLLSATHIAGSSNYLADALSRNNLHLFFANYPQAQPTPSRIPSLLLDLLVHTKPDWTSPSWSSTFNTIFTVPSQRTQYSHTHQASDDMLLSAHSQDSSHSQHQSLYSVNLPPSLASNSLSTDQLNATCQLSDFSKSCILSQIPSSKTCQDSSMCSGELNPKKRRKITNQLNVSQ